MRSNLLLAVALSAAIPAGASAAVLSTTDSPTSAGSLPSGVSVIGGIVLDLVGLNNNRVVSQLAASSLYVGFAGSNPQQIGSQSGFDASVLGALGGGLSELSVRVTLSDGDTAPGDFDDGDNTFAINGTTIGNFSDVETQTTQSNGTAIGMSGFGFENNELDTGFFFTDDATTLSTIFASLSNTETAVYSLDDVDPFDNFYDFTQGLDSSLIDVGTGPTVTPGGGGGGTAVIPVPAGLPLLLTGLAAFGAYRVRRKSA